MEKTQAQALAAVICRVLDYYTACKVFEAASSSSEIVKAVETKRICEANIATALEAIPD